MTPYRGGTDLASPPKRSANGDRDREAKKVRKDRRESGGEEVVIVVGEARVKETRGGKMGSWEEGEEECES